jgi:hypothetical protein
MKNKIPFISLKEINILADNRKIVLFGAGNIAEKTYRIIDKKKTAFIVDNSENLWGDVQSNLSVHNPEKLNNFRKKYFVVICTTSFSEVSDQLKTFGFELNDFAVSPILNDLRSIDELEKINKKLLFSSGAPKKDDPESGGGIYLLDVKGTKWKYEKKISGNCYGIIKFKDNFISIDADLGIFEFNKSFKIIRSKKLPKYSRGHGVHYNEKRSEFYVVCSYLDTILVLDKKFNTKNKIKISDKIDYEKMPSHHCNDCVSHNNSLYVTMFSKSGNWKLDCFDGAIMEIDLNKKKPYSTIVENLWMPHNPKIINGSFYVLDSLRGDLRGNNFNVIGSFPAFTRGLAHDGNYFYVGQSRNRNFSKNIGINNNTSIDAGIIIFDEEKKISRFLQISSKISEIHSIEVID